MSKTFLVVAEARDGALRNVTFEPYLRHIH